MEKCYKCTKTTDDNANARWNLFNDGIYHRYTFCCIDATILKKTICGEQYDDGH